MPHHSTHHLTHATHLTSFASSPQQIIMAVLIFALLGSVTPDESRTRADEVKNGLFSMIAFVLGATTSILCGYLGMKIATYANARTAVEARKGIAPAFMCGECVLCCGWRAAARACAWGLPNACASVVLATQQPSAATCLVPAGCEAAGCGVSERAGAPRGAD